ncbi:hypothetical protein E2C01_003721 [Portunus trituberculatus]|uniref:Uncharacterized protein n=1 Tax=Portunus trituberculatus TaxID=210409 RepID=A0A5B7CPI3_PORTR|nr:hypothetical protein [Portunus trituberculatus]
MGEEKNSLQSIGLTNKKQERSTDSLVRGSLWWGGEEEHAVRSGNSAKYQSNGALETFEY